MFSFLGAGFALLALASFMPFLLDLVLNGNTSGHLQSLVIGAVLTLIAVQMVALGVIGDGLAANRVISQRTYERVRRLELEAAIAPSHYEPGGLEARAEAPAAGPGVERESLER